MPRPRKSGISEAEFQRQVISLALTWHWRVHHQRPALTRGGKWISAIQGHKGFLDLVLVRQYQCLIVELKTITGRLTEDQRTWYDALKTAGMDVRIWTPDNWNEIEDVLSGGMIIHKK